MTKVAVNPEILEWARTTAGLSLEVAAAKLGLKTARGVGPVERLAALEAGDELPTRALIHKMARHYRRPLLVFYLERRPRTGDRGQDFRKLPEDYSPADEALVDALVRDVKARQGIVRSALEDEDEVTPIRFIDSLSMNQGVAHAASAVMRFLGFRRQEFRDEVSADAAFAHLRSKAEAAGIFVLIIGDLGSHHTRIRLEAFRGFALADPIAPFVVLNDQDARSAWSFTLLHELVHLGLGQTGISGPYAETTLESFCNDVASEVLLPLEEVSQFTFGQDQNPAVLQEAVSNYADVRRVSRSMVAYKLFRAGRIDRIQWRNLQDEFRRQWLDKKAEQRRLRKESAGARSGPDYYVVKRHRAGDALLGLVSRFLHTGTLTTTKAGKVLGVKSINVYELIRPAA